LLSSWEEIYFGFTFFPSELFSFCLPFAFRFSSLSSTFRCSFYVITFASLVIFFSFSIPEADGRSGRLIELRRISSKVFEWLPNNFLGLAVTERVFFPS